MRIPYQAFSQHLKSLEVLASPAELHAQASAMLCFNADTDYATWVRAVMTDFCVADIIPEAVQEVFSAVFEMAKKQLADDQYGYNLMLPDDNSELGERLAELSAWVQAFISGLGQAGFSNVGLSSEGREFISDLNAITLLDERVEGVESDEMDYQQVIEYVRCGVMLIYAELNHIQPAINKPN